MHCVVLSLNEADIDPIQSYLQNGHGKCPYVNFFCHTRFDGWVLEIPIEFHCEYHVVQDAASVVKLDFPRMRDRPKVGKAGNPLSSTRMLLY
jgi:hypothetical protein